MHYPTKKERERFAIRRKYCASQIFWAKSSGTLKYKNCIIHGTHFPKTILGCITFKSYKWPLYKMNCRKHRAPCINKQQTTTTARMKHTCCLVASHVCSLKNVLIYSNQRLGLHLSSNWHFFCNFKRILIIIIITVSILRFGSSFFCFAAINLEILFKHSTWEIQEKNTVSRAQFI